MSYDLKVYFAISMQSCHKMLNLHLRFLGCMTLENLILLANDAFYEENTNVIFARYQKRHNCDYTATHLQTRKQPDSHNNFKPTGLPEKIISPRLNVSIRDNNILSALQFEFRSLHSTIYQFQIVSEITVTGYIKASKHLYSK